MTASSSKRGLEETLQRHAINDRDQNDEPGMHLLRSIELPKIARVVGDENKIAGAGIAADIPVLPPDAAALRDIAALYGRIPRRRRPGRR
jgi:hypothetical protein